MTFPLSPQFTDGESLDAALLDARITDPLNELRTLIQDPQMLQLGRSTTLGVTTSVDVPIASYDEVRFSAGTQITNPGLGILTAVVSAYWQWSGTVQWDAATGLPDHSRHLFIYRNGVEPFYLDGKSMLQFSSGDRSVWLQSSVGEIPLDAGDTLQLAVRHNAGVTMDLLSASFGLHRIS